MNFESNLFLDKMNGHVSEKMLIQYILAIMVAKRP